MERRNFLQRLGGVFGLAVFAPEVLKSIPKVEKPEVKITQDDSYVTIAHDFHPTFNNLSTQDNFLNKKFWEYIEKNRSKLTCKIVEVNYPTFVDDNRRYFVETRRCPVYIKPYKEGSYITEWKTLSGGTMTYIPTGWPEKELEETFQILLNWITSASSKPKKYIYYLQTTQIMYNPATYDTYQGIILRGVI